MADRTDATNSFPQTVNPSNGTDPFPQPNGLDPNTPDVPSNGARSDTLPNATPPDRADVLPDTDGTNTLSNTDTPNGFDPDGANGHQVADRLDSVA